MDPVLPTAMMNWHHLACIARKAWTMEAVTIVGSRQAKSVETHDEGSCLEVGRDYLDLGTDRCHEDYHP